LVLTPLIGPWSRVVRIVIGCKGAPCSSANAGYPPLIIPFQKTQSPQRIKSVQM